MGEEVLVPLKTVADAFALMMEYDNISNTASVYNAYYEMKIENNKTIAQVLNFTTRGTSDINLPVAAQVIDGEWYLPLSSFCSVFEKEYYVSDNGLIIIDDKMIDLSNESVTEYLFDEEIETIQIYVSSNGNDEGDGSKSNPYKTMEAAKVKARNYRDKNVFVNIENGEYYLSQKLSFTAEDSKLGMARTIFRGGENSIINGGVTATGWEECSELNGVSGIYRHKLDTVRDYSVIYEGEKQAVPARYPNRSEENISASYMTMEQEAVSSIPKNSFLYGEGFPDLENPSGAEIWMWSGGSDGTHRWHFEKIAINKIDTSTRKVTLNKSAMYELGAGSAYYVANDIKLLDSPGEFYVNKNDGYIYYYPHNKANLEKNIILPDADGVISITGDNDNPVKGIEFENLTLRKTGSESLVYMSGVRNISIENCRLYLSGDCGIDGQNYTQNCIVRGCEVYDIASRGITFTGNGGAYSKNNRIENNHIYNIGRIIKHGDGISMRFSANNVIKNNTIHDGPRFLICVSGTANDATINGDMESIYSKNNLVAFNDLYNGMTESQDGGAFYEYCTYRNVNVSNRIHNTASVNTTRTTHQIAEAMYNDDLTCYNVNRSNLIDNIQKETDANAEYGYMYAGIRQKGAGSLVENNYIVASKLTQGVIGFDSVSDGRAHGGYVYNNIGYTDNAAPVYSRWITANSENNITDANNNLYYNENNTYKIDSYKYYYVITIDTLDELKRYFSLDKNSLTTNPQFVNYEEKDYRLCYDSPAFELGIKDLNIRDIGVTEEFMFSDDAEEIKWLYARFNGDTTDKSYRRMSVGDKVDLDVSARTKTGYLVNMDKAEIIYESDDVTIANVSENGKITALKKGEANINVTVKKGGKTLTLPITVIVE